MLSLTGFFIFLIGCFVAIARNFFDLGLGDTKGVIEETGCLTAGLLVMSAANVVSGFYLACVATSFAAAFNAYVFYDRHYYPSSGLLKSHEMKYILSADKEFQIGERIKHVEVTEEKGICEISDFTEIESDPEEKSYFGCPPNADDYGVFETFGIGRWRYRTENWLRERSLLYSLFTELRERT
jgi:hypothetical protein